MGSSGQFSRSVEDYLKAIYTLSNYGRTASTNDIAERLDVQPASVSGMVKRLAESGLAEHIPYHGVRLTPSGRSAALRVLRRHRIIESYLCTRLGYPWDDVHDEAERLEHAASDTLIERMAAALQDPRHDPHGAPIPSPSGEIEPTDPQTLADATVGSVVRVRAVRDDDSDQLRRMHERGLTPGAHLIVDAPADLAGSVGVRFADGSRAAQVVEADLAGRIYVVTVPPVP